MDHEIAKVPVSERRKESRWQSGAAREHLYLSLPVLKTDGGISQQRQVASGRWEIQGNRFYPKVLRRRAAQLSP